MKRWIVGICILATTLSLAAFIGATTPTVAATPTFTPVLQPWKPCSSGSEIECSRLTVPLDYAHQANGRTVSLALTRLRATRSPYQGLMVTNPGGPGSSGKQDVVLRDDVPDGAGARYDWVGFDPRGVGTSSPALHCDASYFGADRPSFVPTSQALMHYWLKKTKGYAAACGRSSAKALLPHMTTRDTAKDMELLRRAYQAAAPAARRATLADLNFYGFSYGTYLGEVYATIFPSRVGRFVLDGVVDPDTYWYGSNLAQDVAFDQNLNAFFAWVAQRDSRYHLGTSGPSIRRGYNALVKKLVKHPAANGRLGPDELGDAMLGAGYGVDAWPSTAASYARLVRHGDGEQLYASYRSDNAGAANERLYAVYLAVECTDRKRPSWAQQTKDTWRVHRTRPYLAWNNTWYNAPCLEWPAPARAAVKVSGAALASLGTKILLVSETHDGATPYAGALHTRRLFPTASLIAGVGGRTHASSLRGVDCVDNWIAAYLAAGTVPERLSGRRADARCSGYPTPSRVAAGQTLSRSPASRIR
ncbi:MAG: alpha/beta hydrolase [Marmoricola sp.]|nr:alpha/beta hydrolase [Marmoricola sp.]